MLVTAVGVRELAPLPSRSPLFATNFDGTTYAACCEEYSAAAFASRIARAADARLARDRWVPTLSREYRWGGNSKYFIKFIRAKRRFVTRENLMKNLRSFFFFLIHRKYVLFGRCWTYFLASKMYMGRF